MSKMRLSVAALAVIASAGLVNCNNMKANNSTPGAGPELPSELAEQGETEEQKAARLFREMVEARSAVLADLSEMADMSYGDENCSLTELDSEKVKVETSTVNGNTYVLQSPYSRITDSNSSVTKVSIAAKDMATDMSSMDNNFCVVNLGSDTAKDILAVINGDDEISQADYDSLVEKASVLVSLVKPEMDKSVLKINIAQREASAIEKMADNSDLRKSVKLQAAVLDKMIQDVRDEALTCEEETQCSSKQQAYGSMNIDSVVVSKAAQEILATTELTGENDPKIDAKNSLLANTSKSITSKIYSSRAILKSVRDAKVHESNMDQAAINADKKSADAKATQKASVKKAITAQEASAKAATAQAKKDALNPQNK